MGGNISSLETRNEFNVKLNFNNSTNCTFTK